MERIEDMQVIEELQAIEEMQEVESLAHVPSFIPCLLGPSTSSQAVVMQKNQRIKEEIEVLKGAAVTQENQSLTEGIEALKQENQQLKDPRPTRESRFTAIFGIITELNERFCSRLARPMTRSPADNKALVQAAPIPTLAPVTIASLLCQRSIPDEVLTATMSSTINQCFDGLKPNSTAVLICIITRVVHLTTCNLKLSKIWPPRFTYAKDNNTNSQKIDAMPKYSNLKSVSILANEDNIRLSSFYERYGNNNKRKI
uniref:Uncharacterized protein n=1 Tax=Glossina austeni TaxID=7395 RepID=A0A1A9V1E6_GLOAU